LAATSFNAYWRQPVLMLSYNLGTKWWEFTTTWSLQNVRRRGNTVKHNNAHLARHCLMLVIEKVIFSKGDVK